MQLRNLLIIGLLSLSLINNNNISIDNNTKHFQEQKTIIQDVQIDKIVYDNFTTKIDDINKLINDEIVGYIYFGRDTCPACQQFNKFLQKEFNQDKNLLVYKFDTANWRSNEFFRNVLNKYNITEVPMLIKINKDKSYEVFKSKNENELQLNLHEFLYSDINNN